MRQERIASLKANLPWIAAILAAGLVPFLGFLFSGDILFASDQVASPGWKPFFQALRSGELMLWNPLSFAGMPTYDALAGDGTYPPFLLLGLIFPVEKVVGINFVLHVLLGGTFAYILVRGHFKLDRFLSAALAAAYMLNTNYLSLIYSGHTGKFFVLTWLPLGLYFLLGALQKGATWGKLLGLSLTVTAMVLTSHLQLTYYVLMGYFLYYAYVTGVAGKGKRYREVGSLALRFWGPVLLGVGTAFPLFWAPLQYNKEFSVRGEGQRQTYEHATSWSIHPEEAAALVVPEFAGINESYWGRNPFKLNSEYPGLAVWVLGLFGLFAFRRGFFWLWGSVGLLAIIYALGAHTPLFRLFYALIPGVKSFRAPSMMLFWLAAGLLLMSAQALRLLTVENAASGADKERWSRKLFQAGSIAAAVLLLAGVFRDATFGIWNSLMSAEAITNLSNQKAAANPFSLGALRAAALVFFLAFAVRKWLLREVNERFFAAALAAVVVVDLYWTGSHFIETYEFERMFPREAVVEKLNEEKEPLRVFGLPGAYPKGYAQYHMLESADGWADQEYRVYRAYRGGDYNRNPYLMEGLRQNPDGSVEGSKFLDMLNVKYLLYRLPDYPGAQMAENRSAMPRAWFLTQWEQIPGEEQLQRMREAGFDPRRSALVEGPVPESTTPAPQASGDSATKPGGDSAVGSSGGNAKVEIRRESYRSNSLSYRVNTDLEGILVLSETWFPYWQVRVDGEEKPLLRANYLFRGVHLKPGEHRVEMEYHSPPLRRARWVSLGAMVALAGLCLGWARLQKT